MVGVPGLGFKAFDDAALNIRGMGHIVFNPADHDRANGINPSPTDVGTYESDTAGFSRRDCLKADLTWIMEESEGMVVLENWPESPGAKAEITAHHSLFLPVWEYLDFMEWGVQAPTLLPLLSGGKGITGGIVDLQVAK